MTAVAKTAILGGIPVFSGLNGRPTIPDGTVHFVDSSTVWTMGRTFLGEFEQRVLLAILRCDAKAYPI